MNEKNIKLVIAEKPSVAQSIANSLYTVKGESMSAGRLYDKIGDKAKGKIRMQRIFHYSSQLPERKFRKLG